MSTEPCTDEVIRGHWHAVAAVDEIPIGVAQHTALLGEPIGYTRDTNGGLAAWTENGGNPLEIRDDFGYLWTTLATEPVAMFDIPEVREPDRRTLAAVTVGIETSAPRSPR